MFDAIGAFEKQFTRVEGGYLFYPSRKVGGKLVSDEEYEHLIAVWKRVAGRSGRWKTTGAIAAAIVLWMFLTHVFSLPEWGVFFVIPVMVFTLVGRLLWAITKPHRLLKDRLSVMRPKTAEESRRDVRAALTWPFVVFALILSGAAFFGVVSDAERSPGSWHGWSAAE